MIKIVRVKSATARDLKDVNSILPQLSPDAPTLKLSEYKSMLGDKNNIFLAAKDKATIIGMATLVTVRTPSGLRSWIEDVVVDSKYRGQGIGKRLCKALILAARQNKSMNVKLTSRPSRVAANKLYQKLGFQRKITNVYRLKLK